MIEVAIIGGGPAGLSAGLYASRMGMKSVLFEKLTPGGQITLSSEIENYPGVCETVSGLDLMQCWPDQAKKFGCEFIYEETLSLQKVDNHFLITTSQTTYQAKSVIVCTGARAKRAGFENEDSFIGKGISTCAVCDGFFYKNQEVAVLGGGDTALEEALYLSKIASKVYLIHRRESFRACPHTVKQVKEKENIELLLNTTVTKVEGSQFVESLHLLTEGKERVLKIPGLFTFVGYTRNNELLKSTNDFICEVSDQGEVSVNLSMHTSLEGLFAAGDIRLNAAKQVICAAGDGATAALSAVKYVEKLKENE